MGRTMGDWLAEPRPRWWHRCQPAAIGLVDGTVVQRCACGGIKLGRGGKWRQRNTRGRG
jgi:hypothetical protein